MYQQRVVFHLSFLTLLFISTTVFYIPNAQAATSSDGVWEDVATKSRTADEMMVKGVQNYRLVHLDWNKVNTILTNTPFGNHNDGPILELPVPSGEFAKFRIWETSVMAPDLAAKFPEIKTYAGQGIDDPTATVKISVTPENGFQAMILSALRGTIYLDPYTKGDRAQYIVYYRKDFEVEKEFRLQQKDDHLRKQSHELLQRSTLQKISLGAELKTYRLAVAATGEYTTFHGGTVASAQAAIVTAINRVTGIYEREFAIRLQLVDNSGFVFTNPATDGLTNGDDAVINNEIKPIIDAAITATGYDIGHLFHTGGGGIAFVGIACLTSNPGQPAANKAAGATGLPNPVNDPFYVDFVAHELAHQLGADHTFNGTQGDCTVNQRSSSGSNYEPGSGSTIVSYAGICGTDNVVSSTGSTTVAIAGDYMHGGSIEQVFNYTRNDATGMSCGTTAANGNTIPTVDAGPGTNPAYTIPRRTPFELTGTGSDANGDTLSYTWEQFNGGQAFGQLPSEPVAFDPNNTVTNEPADNGPIFRSYPPNASATRVFPRLSDLLNNQIPKGEVLPSTTRDLTFLLTVRDNRAGGGGVNQDDLFLKVDANSGPFIVTSPNTAVTWNSGAQETVTWDVANTTAAPVSCPNVDITLSTDGGNTFATSLAANTPNDGSEQITVPAAMTSTARVKVKCSNNVFFDFSNVNFNIGGGSVNMTVGLGATNGGGWLDQLEGTPPHAHKSWQRVTWAAYDAAVGESRPVECDLDGDGTHELVIGLGSYPANGGWIEIKDDAAAGHAHLAWQRVDWVAYNSADGQTWPACGDVDGDGRDEILVGLGNAGKGWVKGFDDANTNYAALPGTPVANGWIRLNWSNYNNNVGAVHPAIGNLDADNREEIVLGVGSGGLGWVEVLDDSAGNYAHRNWVQVNFPAYNNANGETWPAVCDLDNSGLGEIAIGLGNYPANGGWVQVRDSATAYAPLACINASGWIRIPWVVYNNANGASYPACLNLDGDNADELVLGLGMGAGGWLDVRHDCSSNVGHSSWARVNWPAYNTANGLTRPASRR